MIISKRTALRLLKTGKAKKETSLKPEEIGRVFVALTRFDKQRTDHFQVWPFKAEGRDK
jgi:hypothetical protein